MDEGLQVAVEMAKEILEGLSKDLDGLTPEEAEWRPLPEANSIALIVRHLAIESQWHRACLEQGEPMPHETTDDLQRVATLLFRPEKLNVAIVGPYRSEKRFRPLLTV